MNNVFWTIEDPSHFAWYGYLSAFDLNSPISPFNHGQYLRIYKPLEKLSITNQTYYTVGEDYD
jgi:hypothetical protein